MFAECTENERPIFGQSEPICLGSFVMPVPAILAPMSGVTDAPFRRLAWEFGAGLVVSEMVASEAFSVGHEEMRLKAETAGIPVHMVQLAGRDARWMGEAVRIAEGAGASIIDINMGCPSKRVVNGYSGSALMRDLDHALTLIDAVVAATDLPVTLKMRLGWDRNSINAPALARRAVDAGVQMITVHGRTRDQFYKGVADWSAVKAVREAIPDTPLVVNGDIVDTGSARAALAASGADAVMVGRATYGAPWLVGQIGAALAGRDPKPSPQGTAFADLVARHYEAMLSLYGETFGVRNARKHLDWYGAHLSAGALDAPTRKRLMTGTDPAETLRLISEIFRCTETAQTPSEMAA